MISVLSVVMCAIAIGCGTAALVALVKFVAEIQRDIRADRT